MLAAVLIVYALVYARAVGFSLVWDDQVIARPGAFSGPLLTLLGAQQQTLLDPVASETRASEVTYDSYRPLATLSRVIDLRWLGGSPAIMHAHSLLLGAIAILLAYRLVRHDLSERAALACVALFALHPLQAEALAYVSARDDVLAGLFALAAVLLALRAMDVEPNRQRIAFALGSQLAYLASLLSKEAYAGVPAIVLCLGVARGKLRLALPVVYAQALGILAYLLLRTAAMGAAGGKLGHSPLDALVAWPGVTLQYARSFLLPFDLSIDRPLDRALTLPGGALVGVLLGLAFAALRRAELRAEAGRFLLGYACALLLLGPAAAAAADGGVAADRYAYLAVLAFAYLSVAGYQALTERRARRVLAAAGVAWGLLLGFVLWTQIGTFASNATLYAHAVAFEPASANAQYRMGYLHARRGELLQARAYFERAVELDPKHLRARNNLGAVLLDLNELSAAKAQLEQVVALAPQLSYRAWYNLARVRERLGDRAGACQAATTSNAVNPAYDKAKQALPALCGAP
jgi:protein O-mannosyl-transferase